jgi:hypothetical protein
MKLEIRTCCRERRLAIRSFNCSPDFVLRRALSQCRLLENRSSLVAQRLPITLDISPWNQEPVHGAMGISRQLHWRTAISLKPRSTSRTMSRRPRLTQPLFFPHRRPWRGPGEDPGQSEELVPASKSADRCARRSPGRSRLPLIRCGYATGRTGLGWLNLRFLLEFWHNHF